MHLFAQVTAPWSWLIATAEALHWPAVVVGAFFAGRHITKLEGRVLQAEKNVASLVDKMGILIESHMPHIHTALEKILDLLERR